MEDDQGLANYQTYEDYLDSHVTPLDTFYLEDPLLARHVLDIGGRKSDILSRADFEQKKSAILAFNKSRLRSIRTIERRNTHDVSNSPFLKALLSREEALRNGSLLTILYVLGRNKQGQEVSGYIDLAEKLFSADYDQIFSGRTPLLPTPTDLSFFNWATKQSAQLTETFNFQAIIEPNQELAFRVKTDQAVIRVTNSDCTRIYPGGVYSEAALFDHYL